MLEVYPKTGPRPRLLIRLSSLGDVIQATSAFEHFSKIGEKVDWLVATEYAELLEGHPAIRKVWSFDRKTGFSGWWRLGRALWAENFTEVIDLHASLRSRTLRVLFRIWGIGRTGATWKVHAKLRHRLWGFYVFKRFWSKNLRPTPQTARFARLLGGSGDERPNLKHLLKTPVARAFRLPQTPYLCVMPGSRWAGKRWPVARFVEALAKSARENEGRVVVLGAKSDRESFELAAALKARGVEVISGVGIWNLTQAAAVLAGAVAYVGNDTGLAHLAEAVGTRAGVVFGPTHSDMGFGPWKKESRVFQAELGCRPCGKDGRICYRFWDRYACLARIDSDVVTGFAGQAFRESASRTS